ncbi:MAG TPA: hypothetical protein VEF72_16895 [Mycobacterium sp.]|nr:hypothetical protein [Mycobacterium sp.]
MAALSSNDATELEKFRTRVVAEHPDWTKRQTSTRDPLYYMATGVRGAVYSTGFMRDEGLVVQLLFKDPDPTVNLARFEALRANK